MALKDWKLAKYRSEEYTMYVNSKPQFKSFRDNYYITYGFNGESYWISITKEGVGKGKQFKTKKLMLAYARKYMRSH